MKGFWRLKNVYQLLKVHKSGQIKIIIPKPELRGFWGDSLTKPPFGVTSAEVAIICPDKSFFVHQNSEDEQLE